ncbi:MAG: cobalamin-dependent protein [Ilumatobacteraceae bacterium]
MNSEPMSLDDAAKVLGVHYMTVYRYVRQGKLAATRVKGVWQVTHHALEEFRKRSNERATTPRSSTDARRTGDYSGELLRCLVNADAGGAWQVIQRAIDAGSDTEEVYLDIVSPALAEIGGQWSRGEIDISIEHQATVIVTRLVGQLSPRFVRRGRRRGDILIGGPAGERHALPLAMLADLLRLEGWEVLDLGADTPANSFVHAASRMPGLTAVGVSVTTPVAVPGAVEVVQALRRAIGDEVPVVLGGAAIADAEVARELGADFFAEGARGFVEFLNELSGRPSSRRSSAGRSGSSVSDN